MGKIISFRTNNKIRASIHSCKILQATKDLVIHLANHKVLQIFKKPTRKTLARQVKKNYNLCKPFAKFVKNQCLPLVSTWPLNWYVPIQFASTALPLKFLKMGQRKLCAKSVSRFDRLKTKISLMLFFQNISLPVLLYYTNVKMSQFSFLTKKLLHNELIQQHNQITLLTNSLTMLLVSLIIKTKDTSSQLKAT